MFFTSLISPVTLLFFLPKTPSCGGGAPMTEVKEKDTTC